MRHKHKRRGHSSSKNIIFAIILIILLAILGGLFYINHMEEVERRLYYEGLNQKMLEEQHDREESKAAEEMVRLEQFNNSSFYKKLAYGFDVNILFVGDSIAEYSGASDIDHSFNNLLVSNLRKTYGSNVTATNVSMGGNTSYAGYVRTMALENNVNYDLAIICYGQNDSETEFSLYYETIIKAICSKYSQCSIISVMEHCQRDYTAKMQIIQDICKYYSIPVADTIVPFQKKYDSLVKVDGVHPNDAGHELYAETIGTLIDEHVNANTGFPNYAITPINSRLSTFQNFRYISKSEFARTDNTYIIDISASGVLGIDYQYTNGENLTEIYIDEELFVAPMVTFNYDFSQRHILIVSEDCTVGRNIKVKFSTAEQADGFEGLIFSWEQ